ncbi:helix-turn-helix domain-containing protein [Spirosoma sp. KNUC1025]|uniref:helix-turn-helix domain-containing protein n=1 Tax=Spirosoma sp. KNUC1025 TaxID=2894082 RepID=UPI00386F2163|nr:AraC family transcriptional regulator [Spirosoma sp. KNUC1025]
MTFYQEQVQKLRDQVLPQSYQVGKIIRAKQFIDTNFSDTIDLNAIAEAAALSKFHFLRLFKKCYGRTPHQYYTEQRLRKAKQLLRAGVSTADVCDTLHFGSVTTFTGLFKRYTGSTPAAYQRKSNSQEAEFLISMDLCPVSIPRLHENQTPEHTG